MRAALGVELEIKNFEKRLKSLAANIQEQQEKRQAALLTVISIISSISIIDPVIELAESAKEYWEIDDTVFTVLMTAITVSIAIPLLTYLFPLYTKRIWKKWNSFFKND
jgi:hypothetical protein